MFVFNSLIQL